MGVFIQPNKGHSDVNLSNSLVMSQADPPTKSDYGAVAALFLHAEWDVRRSEAQS